MKLTKEQIEEKDGKELLELYRKLYLLEERTLPRAQRVILPSNHLMYQLVSNEIEILSKTIGGRAKTKIRRACKERGIKVPNFKEEGSGQFAIC